MIDEDERFSPRPTSSGSSPSNVQRNYVFGWPISGICETSTLVDQLVLKGGNAMRKVYFPMTRFSDDLDLTTTGVLDAAMKEFWPKDRLPRISMSLSKNAVTLVKNGITELFAVFNHGAEPLAGKLFPPELRVIGGWGTARGWRYCVTVARARRSPKITEEA